MLHRAGWLGNEQLCHHLPKTELQVTLSVVIPKSYGNSRLYENRCPEVGRAADVSGGRQTLRFSPDWGTPVQQLQLQFWLVLYFLYVHRKDP